MVFSVRHIEFSKQQIQLTLYADTLPMTLRESRDLISIRFPWQKQTKFSSKHTQLAVILAFLKQDLVFVIEIVKFSSSISRRIIFPELVSATIKVTESADREAQLLFNRTILPCGLIVSPKSDPLSSESNY